MANQQTRNRAVNSAGGFMRDFQAFLMRGNVVDLAVAVIIGGAFGAVVNSFIADIVTPLILTPALSAAGVEDIAELSANGVKYGLFLSAIMNFIVIAFVIFVMVRLFERAKRKEEVEAAAEPSVDEKLNETLTKLTEVMDRKL
ncbi:large conductance mechanosensitive channel protein MscL [Halomicronema sp. CCY15110]|uniref:large conductance mechanosensitive channel protein MscL n=1 Tax=Halomicronema sp. CCY15110 TaxID=2767773 RepID=UPI00194DF0EC|nr:large conductance mechanosensitive channel protein MscL [Halomicronema sp. CCY15110]